MKYAILATSKHNTSDEQIIAETDIMPFAFQIARTYWENLGDITRSQTQISVIESADADANSADHTSGTVLGFLTNEVYDALIDMGMEPFNWNGKRYVTIERPAFCKEWDYADGRMVAWYEADAIRLDDMYRWDDGQPLYRVHWDLDAAYTDMDDCDEEYTPFSECYPEPMDVVEVDYRYDAREYSAI